MVFFWIYLYLSLAVGLLGHNTRGGIVGTFLLSLVFTPLIALLFVLALGPARAKHSH